MNCNDEREFFNENDTTVIAVLTTLHDFQQFYSAFHRYISLLLCVFGLCFNCVHIWVLTRPRMLQSSVHTVLTCIAIADIGTMSSYLIYLLRYEFGRSLENGYPYGWVLFLKLHAAFSIALHAISLYLVVFMAYIRLCAIRARNSRWLQTHLAGFTSLMIATVVFVLCIPTLLAHEIYPQKRVLPGGHRSGSGKADHDRQYTAAPVETKYSIGFSAMVLRNNCALLKMNLWLTGIMLKAVPCFLLLWLTFALLLKLRANRKKRMRLLGLNSSSKSKDGQSSLRDRTTSMLLLMLCVFIATELPQGVMAILNAIYTEQFHLYVYLTLADVLDVLSLINCYVGFTVFFCTCTRYRQTLLTLFPKRCCVFVSALKSKSSSRDAVEEALLKNVDEMKVNLKAEDRADRLPGPKRRHLNELLDVSAAVATQQTTLTNGTATNFTTVLGDTECGEDDNDDDGDDAFV